MRLTYIGRARYDTFLCIFIRKIRFVCYVNDPIMTKHKAEYRRLACVSLYTSVSYACSGVKSVAHVWVTNPVAPYPALPPILQLCM